MKTIVYFAHPRAGRSGVNAKLYQAAKATHGVTTVDLYAEYPTFEIDVDREQARLLAHDAIVLQHPIYWYSAPSIIKEWQDLVLEHGFAYGHTGHALDGKIAFNSVTCGADRATYRPSGGIHSELRGLLAPFEKTFDLCRMTYLAPFVLYAAGHAEEDGRLQSHISDYRYLLEALVDDRIDLTAAAKASTLSDNIPTLITPAND